MNREKDPFLCAAGSFFFPGLGQVYSGHILRGVIFLIPAMILSIPSYLLPTIHFWIGYPSWLTYGAYFTGFVSKIVDFIVRVVATYDAYHISKASKAL